MYQNTLQNNVTCIACALILLWLFPIAYGMSLFAMNRSSGDVLLLGILGFVTTILLLVGARTGNRYLLLPFMGKVILDAILIVIRFIQAVYTYYPDIPFGMDIVELVGICLGMLIILMLLAWLLKTTATFYSECELQCKYKKTGVVTVTLRELQKCEPLHKQSFSRSVLSDMEMNHTTATVLMQHPREHRPIPKLSGPESV